VKSQFFFRKRPDDNNWVNFHWDLMLTCKGPRTEREEKLARSDFFGHEVCCSSILADQKVCWAQSRKCNRLPRNELYNGAHIVGKGAAGNAELARASHRRVKAEPGRDKEM